MKIDVIYLQILGVKLDTGCYTPVCLSRSRISLEFVPENLDKTRHLAESMDKTWNVKICNISILYWNNVFHVLYSCDFRMHLVSAFWCQNCLHCYLHNGLFWTGQNLKIIWNFIAKKPGNPDRQILDSQFRKGCHTHSNIGQNVWRCMLYTFRKYVNK